VSLTDKYITFPEESNNTKDFSNLDTEIGKITI
jgi:hypothetical protein